MTRRDETRHGNAGELKNEPRLEAESEVIKDLDVREPDKERVAGGAIEPTMTASLHRQ